MNSRVGPLFRSAFSPRELMGCPRIGRCLRAMPGRGNRRARRCSQRRVRRRRAAARGVTGNGTGAVEASATSRLSTRSMAACRARHATRSRPTAERDGADDGTRSTCQSIADPGNRRFGFPGRVKAARKVDRYRKFPFLGESPDGAELYEVGPPTAQRRRRHADRKRPTVDHFRRLKERLGHVPYFRRAGKRQDDHRRNIGLPLASGVYQAPDLGSPNAIHWQPDGSNGNTLILAGSGQRRAKPQAWRRRRYRCRRRQLCPRRAAPSRRASRRRGWRN